MAAFKIRSGISNAAQAHAVLAPLFDIDGPEKVAVAHFDERRRLLRITEHVGGGQEVEIPVRWILGEALRLGARGMIVAHNHPSGDPLPSPEDRAATRTLAQTARQLGIILHDHLVFAGGECRSFRALGLL